MFSVFEKRTPEVGLVIWTTLDHCFLIHLCWQVILETETRSFFQKLIFLWNVEKIKGELVSVNMLSSKTELENRISELENKGFDRDAIQEQLDGHFVVSNVLKNSVLKNIFNFKGRASRKEFWPAFFKFNILAFIVSVIVGNVCRNESVGATISFIAFLIAFCLLLSVAVRRLHDAGFSGYVMIPLFITPLHPVLWILLSLSSKGDNKYGPKPKI